MVILAIDPGPKESGYCFYRARGKEIMSFGKIENIDLCKIIDYGGHDTIVIEKIESYGMPVGADVFETVFWSGRFYEIAGGAARIPRKEVKIHLCGSMRAKDSNIITRIVDIYDPDRKFGKHGKGTKSKPGPLYGMSKDAWHALALAITYAETTVEVE